MLLYLLCQEASTVAMHSDSTFITPIYFKFGMMIDTIKVYILILVFVTLTLISKSQRCKKVKTTVPVLDGFGWN